jgi:hypothetical protein
VDYPRSFLGRDSGISVRVGPPRQSRRRGPRTSENQVILINAVAAVPWTISHGDSEFERRNREVVGRLKSVF